MNDNEVVPPGNRIPYERYFEVSAVPEPGVPMHSYAYLRRLTSGVLETSPVWDAHAHIGRDRDGRELNMNDLLDDLDEYHVSGAVIFPFNDPEQGADFRVPNDRIWAAYERAPERFIPFMRLNPNGPWEAEYQRCCDRGHRGIKLHPRAQSFDLDSPVARELLALAATDGLPVLIHTGYGMRAVSDDLAAIAEALPDLSLILGHSTFIDMPRAVEVLAPYPNVYFETSVVRAYDLFTVLDMIDPVRVIYGSDLPYASSANSLHELAVMANIAGVDTGHFANLFGGNLLRLLGSEVRQR
ncbi:MAG TPA: amidohydrolase family protein [Pilimelia sp.]|nr:amidohydrolase family protein [Pilimelia sp.]